VSDVCDPAWAAPSCSSSLGHPALVTAVFWRETRAEIFSNQRIISFSQPSSRSKSSRSKSLLTTDWGSCCTLASA
jgi:hypothetical protein